MAPPVFCLDGTCAAGTARCHFFERTITRFGRLLRAAVPLRMLLAIEKRSSLQFVLLCSSHFLFACSFNMPIPELPAYLESMGGKEYLGLIIALTTLMA